MWIFSPRKMLTRTKKLPVWSDCLAEWTMTQKLTCDSRCWQKKRKLPALHHKQRTHCSLIKAILFVKFYDACRRYDLSMYGFEQLNNIFQHLSIVLVFVTKYWLKLVISLGVLANSSKAGMVNFYRLKGWALGSYCVLGGEGEARHLQVLIVSGTKQLAVLPRSKKSGIDIKGKWNCADGMNLLGRH